MTAKMKIAYLVAHPIQYQAPLLARLAAEPDFDLKVFFCSDFTTRRFYDKEFHKAIEWDIPLLDGYRYEFLPFIGSNDRVTSWKPFNYGLSRKLREDQFDGLWVHGYSRALNLYALYRAKAMGMRTAMRDEATAISSPRSALKQKAKRFFFRRLAGFCDRFLAIGSLNRDYYVQNGIPADRVTMVPYAVDNAFFRSKALEAEKGRQPLRHQCGITSDAPIILFASKLRERKRPQDLLEAYRRLSSDGKTPPRAHLLFVGDGDQRATLQQRAEALGWPTIHFVGFVNQRELPRYYDLCSVFVLPSVQEPWGLVVNEAMNAARPVIVSDEVGCGPDLVKNGVNGFIFKAGDIDQLSQALSKVLRDSNAAQMGRASLSIIESWGFDQDVAGLRQAFKK
jgi:glycosyltransferase involved in cell wall biosynthesis